jgi:hypothetical protein
LPISAEILSGNAQNAGEPLMEGRCADGRDDFAGGIFILKTSLLFISKQSPSLKKIKKGRSLPAAPSLRRIPSKPRLQHHG